MKKLKLSIDETQEAKDINIKLGVPFKFAGFIDTDVAVIHTTKVLTLWKNNDCTKSIQFNEIYKNNKYPYVKCCFNKFIAVYSKNASGVDIYDRELNLLCELRLKSNIKAVGWSLSGKLAIGLGRYDIELWEMKDNLFYRTKTGAYFSIDDVDYDIIWSSTEYFAINMGHRILILCNDLGHVITYYSHWHSFVNMWISGTELLFAKDKFICEVRNINAPKQIWNIDEIQQYEKILPISNEILLCLTYSNRLVLLIKNDNIDRVTIKKIKRLALNIFWSPKGNLIADHFREITTYNLPEISLLKLIPLGLMAENTIWSDFLKEGCYDPRLFLFIADLFRDPNLFKN